MSENKDLVDELMREVRDKNRAKMIYREMYEAFLGEFAEELEELIIKEIHDGIEQMYEDE